MSSSLRPFLEPLFRVRLHEHREAEREVEFSSSDFPFPPLSASGLAAAFSSRSRISASVGVFHGAQAARVPVLWSTALMCIHVGVADLPFEHRRHAVLEFFGVGEVEFEGVVRETSDDVDVC